MEYSYHLKHCLLGNKKTVKRLNRSLYGVGEDDVLFDGVKLVIPSETPVSIVPEEEVIYIGKKKYFFNDDGNFTSTKKPVMHSFMIP